MCGCKFCISDKSKYSSLLSWQDLYLKNSMISAKMLKTEGPGKMKILIYETYKNTVIPHRRHIYDNTYDTTKAIMCA